MVGSDSPNGSVSLHPGVGGVCGGGLPKGFGTLYPAFPWSTDFGPLCEHSGVIPWGEISSDVPI